MTKTATTFQEMTRPPKARLSPALLAAQEMLRGSHLVRETPEQFGLRFKLRTLEPFEEDEAMSLVPQMTVPGDSIKKAFLATSISAINDEPVEVAFAIPDGLAPDILKSFEVSKELERDWRRRQVLDYLNHTQSELIDHLWNCYVGMVMEQRTALSNIGPLAKATATGESSPTSSPEKAS